MVVVVVVVEVAGKSIDGESSAPQAVSVPSTTTTVRSSLLGVMVCPLDRGRLQLRRQRG